MNKNFEEWNSKKQDIHNNKPRVLFQEREIWFCQLGENIGFEQNGKGRDFLRPVIVIKKFNKESLLIVPLTKTNKSNPTYYFSFSFKKGIMSSAVLSQIRLIDAKRLKYKTGYMKIIHFTTIKEKIRQLFA